MMTIYPSVTMNCGEVVNQLVGEYIGCPIEYGTEADLRVRLYQLLLDELESTGGKMADVRDPRLLGETRTYKRTYKETVEDRLRERGTIRRVRLDASIDKRQQYDVVVFNETLESPVEWIRSGSKRFDEDDLAAALNIKFIKNKCYPPTQCSITDDSILEMESDELRSELNVKENNLRGDLEALQALPDSVRTFFVLVSNNNYLFAEPLGDEERRELKKRRVGEAVRDWLGENAGGVNVRYVHPNGSTWVSRPRGITA